MVNVIKNTLATSFLGDVLIACSHAVKDWYFTCKWYIRTGTTCNKTAVAVVDGRLYTGGMTDRFKGIVSLYAWSKEHDVDFRIQYTSPFKLRDYLQPSQYDWIPKEGDYICSSKCARVVYAVGEKHFARRLNIIHKLNQRKQLHFYGNRDILIEKEYSNYNWGVLFHELFKPAASLQQKLDELKEQIGSEYFAVTLRFQNLLGDFPEYGFKSLVSETERKNLMIRCEDKIHELINESSIKRCLVTSDSITFLKRVSKINGVFVIPGSLVHIGSNANGTYEQYEKSFLDFFMLADSYKIYNIVYGQMYPSGFPQFAAKVNNVVFERING